MIQSTKVGAQALEGTNDGAAVSAWGEVAEFEDEHGPAGGVGVGEEVGWWGVGGRVLVVGYMRVLVVRYMRVLAIHHMRARFFHR